MARRFHPPNGRGAACAECGSRDRDGENLEYEDATTESGITLRFVCRSCLDHFARLVNEEAERDAVALDRWARAYYESEGAIDQFNPEDR